MASTRCTPAKADMLKGFGEGDALLGQQGDDTLFGGANQDFLIGGKDDDRLRGGDALDIYYFERSDWGQDTIIEASPSRNILRLPDSEGFGGAVTTNLNSDSGHLSEVTNAGSGSTVNWKGNAIAIIIGSTGNDTVTGNDSANLIDAQDSAADDKVECGAGYDTVYFDQELELVFPDECEEKNPIPNTLERRQAPRVWEEQNPVPTLPSDGGIRH